MAEELIGNLGYGTLNQTQSVKNYSNAFSPGNSKLYLGKVYTEEKIKELKEPQNPQYKKLKSREFTSLNLKITDQNNNVITDGPQVTVVLHVCDRKI